MPKTIRNVFDKSLTFEKLMEAHKRARSNKVYRKELVEFEFNLENNIINLYNNIKNNKYKLGKYKAFKVYEPKERVIKSLPYIDRIVHQWYVEEFIKPYILPKLIYTTFACIPDRGTHKAVYCVENQMRVYKRLYHNYWILKCDIRKFFYTINCDILFRILSKYISDKKLLAFTKLLIYDSRDSENIIGIPIGNYTSQFFANIYLNELDNYVKRVLKIKFYTRYMDDFILILKSKKDCIFYKKKIEDFLEKDLHLELNDKSKYYPSKMGVNFCGYRIFETHKLLRTSSKKRIRKKVKIWNFLYSKNNLNIKLALNSLNSWKGHTLHCNSYNLERKINNSCNFIFSDSTYNQIEENLINLIENDFPHSI